MARWHSTSAARNLAAVEDRVRIHECDLRDLSSVLGVLREVRPDVIFHLASHANVRTSFVDAARGARQQRHGHRQSVRGAPRRANSIRSSRSAAPPRSTARCSPKRCRSRKSSRCRPSSPYAVSKVAQDLLGLTYFRQLRDEVLAHADVRLPEPAARRPLRQLFRTPGRAHRGRSPGASSCTATSTRCAR